MPRRRMLLPALLVSALIVPPSAGQGMADSVVVRLFDNRIVTGVTLIAVDSDMSLFAGIDQEAISVVRPGESGLASSTSTRTCCSPDPKPRVPSTW